MPTANLKKLMERQDVQALVQLLHQAGEATRAEIIQILAEIRDPRATEALLREAQSGDMTLRRLVAQSLKKIDPDRKYIAAVHMLNDVHRAVRTGAAGILATLGHPQALDALTGMLQREKDPQARAAAAKAVGQLKDRRGLGPLRSALDDPDDRVRSAAADALGVLGDRTVLPDLFRLSEQDPEHKVRDAAERAISKLQRFTA